MRGISKKMLISILTSVVVFVTMIATTFAWVGIFTYANTDKFSLNLKVQDLDSNYYLTISSSGEKNTFSSEVQAIEIKRQIVSNKYGARYNNENNSIIESIFNDIRLAPSTTKINSNNTIDTFYSVDYNNAPLKMNESNGFYKFDLYLSVGTKEGINEETTGINANVLLSNIENILTGTISEGLLMNGNPFQDLPSRLDKQYYETLKSIPTSYKVNSKNAVRFSISAYSPIEINSNYTGDENPLVTKIYEGGNEIPNYDESVDTYDLGGILPLEENLALQELLVIRKEMYSYDTTLFLNSLEEAINRKDYELIEDNKYLWNKSEHTEYLGCMNGVQTKMKLTIHVWFEGWDADCLKLIEEQPISLNLSFTSGRED